jgi:hypothetical protein
MLSSSMKLATQRFSGLQGHALSFSPVASHQQSTSRVGEIFGSSQIVLFELKIGNNATVSTMCLIIV